MKAHLSQIDSMCQKWHYLSPTENSATLLIACVFSDNARLKHYQNIDSKVLHTKLSLWCYQQLVTVSPI